jgi:hypothetical protein
VIVAPNSVDVSTYFKLVNPTTGVPVTGATITDLDATYIRDRAAAVTADLTALAAVDSVHADNKAIQIDATNAPGVYRVDWPDAAFATGSARVQLVVNGAAVDPAVLEVELAPWLTLITGATVLTVNATIAAAVWNLVLSSYNVKNSAAAYVKKAGGGATVTLFSGTATAGTSTSITLDATAPAVANVLNQNLIAITGGLGAGQTRRIITYSVGRVAVVDRPFVVTPNATSTYEVIAAASSVFSDEGVVVSADATHIQFQTTAPSSDNVLNGSLVSITGGPGDGDTQIITDYVGSTRIAEIAGWAGLTPTTASSYAVIPQSDTAPDSGGGTSAPSVLEIAAGVWAELLASYTGAGSAGKTLADALVDTAEIGAAGAGLTAVQLAAAGVDAILDEVVEGTLTLRQIMMLLKAVNAGKSSGGGTPTLKFQDHADSKARITATVDNLGNRTAVTLDVTP